MRAGAKKLMSSAVLMAFVLTGATAYAHDGHAHTIRGVVTARDTGRIEVQTPGGEKLSIAINPQTLVTRDKRKVAIADVEPGRRVIVDIGNGEDPLIARGIKVGVMQVTESR